jgi:hypothetical protein
MVYFLSLYLQFIFVLSETFISIINVISLNINISVVIHILIVICIFIYLLEIKKDDKIFNF